MPLCLAQFSCWITLPQASPPHRWTLFYLAPGMRAHIISVQSLRVCHQQLSLRTFLGVNTVPGTGAEGTKAEHAQVLAYLRIRSCGVAPCHPCLPLGHLSQDPLETVG